MVKGYTQQKGINYEAKFSPIVKFTSIHIFLAILAHLDLELHQIGKRTTFLNRELEMKFMCYNKQVLLLKVKSK